MEDGYELINVTIFNPTKSLFGSSGNDRAEMKKFYCENKSNCELHSDGRCINIANMFKKNCPYGKVSREIGFTKRARKFYSWISEREKKHADNLYKLNSPKNKLARVGDFIYLPYAHMDMNKNIDFNAHSGFMQPGLGMLAFDQFNTKAIASIVSFRPQAMLGGEIKGYQQNEVPKFLKDLEDLMPELYESLCEEYPDIRKRNEDYSYIGRKAYIHSLKAGVEIVVKKGFGEGVYVWDGEYLTCKNYNPSFPVVKFDEIELKIKPKIGESVEITSNNQVDRSTKFED